MGRVGLSLRAGEGGDGESGALAKTLVVDGWWLLVNEGVCGLFVRRKLMIRFQLEFTPAQAGA